MPDVQLPGTPINATGTDIAAPTQTLLRALSLLPQESDLAAASGARAIIFGPPDSVAVIEAGATALSKAWALALGAGAAGLWASVVTFWNDLSPENRGRLLISASVASAALILSIGYIVASDVRGRAAASVATIQARAAVADAFLRAAESATQPASSALPATETAAWLVVGIAGTKVQYITRQGEDEEGWTAFAVKTKPDGSGAQFLVSKSTETIWADANQVSVHSRP